VLEIKALALTMRIPLERITASSCLVCQDDERYAFSLEWLLHRQEGMLELSNPVETGHNQLVASRREIKQKLAAGCYRGKRLGSFGKRVASNLLPCCFLYARMGVMSKEGGIA
jgi:hypothetical protein